MEYSSVHSLNTRQQEKERKKNQQLFLRQVNGKVEKII